MKKLSKDQIQKYFLPYLPKNKRGFSSQFDPVMIIQCILHKLKTGCQWKDLFIDLEGFKYPFSWQTVYYYYNKWSKAGVFEKVYNAILEDHKNQLDTSVINLDGTQSLAKKGAKK